MKNYVNDFQSFVIDEAIKTYESYTKTNYKVSIVNALIESNTLSPETQYVLESIAENNQYDNLWEGSVNEEFINENLNEEKFKVWFAKKKEAAKETLQDIAKAGAEKLTAAKKVVLDKAKQTYDLFKSFGDWVGKILNAVKVGLQKLWKSVYAGVESKFAGKENQIIAGAAGKMKKDPEKSKNEVKNLAQMGKGGVKWVTGGFAELMNSAINDAGNVDPNESQMVNNLYDVTIHEAVLQCVSRYGMEFINEITESELILEGGHEGIKIPGLSKLTQAMHELPIFKQLADIEHAAGKVANTALDKLSYILNKVGAAGGPYQFSIIGAIIGMGVEYYVKSKIKTHLGLDGPHHESEEVTHSNEEIFEGGGEGHGKNLKQYLAAAGVSGAILLICLTIPGFGFVFGLMKSTANVLWWYTFIQAGLALLDNLADGKISKGVEDVKDKITNIFKEKKKEVDEETEKNIEKAKEESDEELTKGGKDDDEKKK